MKKFDLISKNYIANNERFADLFNCYIFRGEPVLTAEGLEERMRRKLSFPIMESNIRQSKSSETS